RRSVRFRAIRAIVVIAIGANVHTIEHHADQFSTNAADSGLGVHYLLARYRPALYDQEHSDYERCDDAAISQPKHRGRVEDQKVILRAGGTNELAHAFGSEKLRGIRRNRAANQEVKAQ